MNHRKRRALLVDPEKQTVDVLVYFVDECLREADGDLDRACEILDDRYSIEMTPEDLGEIL